MKFGIVGTHITIHKKRGDCIMEVSALRFETGIAMIKKYKHLCIYINLYRSYLSKSNSIINLSEVILRTLRLK